MHASIQGIGVPVARLVLGTASLARSAARPGGLLDRVFEAGGNAFDTARVYGLGSSERVLGRWMRSRGIRDKVVIVTKGVHPHLLTFRSRLDRASILADLRSSLKTLRTDYIDLYLLHRDDPSLPVEALIDSLNELQRLGLVRAFGVSNWTHLRIAQGNRHARESGLSSLAASSPHFSLAEWRRAPFPGCVSIAGPAGLEARGWYHGSAMPVLAWSGLAAGYFARPGGGAAGLRADGVYRLPSNSARRDRVQALAARTGLTPSQVALAYLFAQPFVVFPVVSTRSADRFRANAQALDHPLTPAEARWLETGRDE